MKIPVLSTGLALAAIAFSATLACGDGPAPPPAATAPATQSAPAATQAGTPKALANTITQAIALLEAGKNEDAVKLLMPPADLQKKGLQNAVKAFEPKVTKLLAALKDAQSINPTMKNANTAVYPKTDAHPSLQFIRVNDAWYIH
jgi:hypothetical protein